MEQFGSLRIRKGINCSRGFLTNIFFSQWATLQQLIIYIFGKKKFGKLLPTISRIFPVLTPRVPIERVFNQEGIFLRPHKARIFDKLLVNFVFLKSNE